MRYDDASQTGSTGHSEPVARPDEDRLPPGSFGPATGNTITGAGTTSGASGADHVGAGATITAVQGAGGQTVNANGAYQAAGQYGLLSMDMQGNFSYVRNPGTPDGVKDVFNYTLADSTGANSSTTLTIDIGQIAAAAAGQGIVNLPQGVELSDIHVNGRDLIVNMPDGTQMVIPGGAVFVPQLVIGDVQVPPTNLAALLVDNEPQPAAGNTPSSGGNFATDVPPLDPGVPLGDLIPPTELTYTPPEFRPIGQFENQKPTVIIEPHDLAPGAVDAVDQVNEAGLPAPRDGNVANETPGSGEIADGIGNNNSDNSENTFGQIVFTSGDGLQSITVDGVAITGASVGTTIQGQFGTMTITSVNLAAGTIGYTYSLTDNTSGDNTADHFTVIVTDHDGDTATATLTVDIIDDVPTAHNDTDAIVGNDQSTDGNVMTGAGTTSGAAGADVVGADNATVTGAHPGSASGSFTSVPQDGSGVTIHGTFGDLVLHDDGTYTYTRSDVHQGGTDVFTYQLTDGDGDTSTATLTITVPQVNQPPVVEGAETNVSEEGLVGGNPDSTGSPDTTNSETASGSIGASDPDNDALTISLQAPSGSFTSGGVPVTWALSDNGHTLTGSAGENTIITITIDNSGHYDVTLSGPLDDPNPNAEDSVAITVPVSVSDGIDTTPGTLVVTVEDDSPVVNPTVNADATVTLDETGPAVASTIDTGAIAKGDDPDVAGSGAISSATSGSAIVNAHAAFGGDGPAASDALTYALSITNGSSGLTTTDGSAINLVMENGAIVGVVSGGAFDGQAAFAISINSNTGVVTVEQYLSLDHPDTTNPNDALHMLTGSVGVTVTATDADGDHTTSGAVDVSNQITFLDDGPTVSPTLHADATVTLDETGPAVASTINTGAIVKGDDPDVAGSGAISKATSGTAVVDAHAAFGADGPAVSGSLAYALSITNSSSGLTTTDGHAINLIAENGVIVGVVSGGAFDGEAAFAISIDPSTGVVTVEQYLSLDHPDTTNPNDALHMLTGSVGVTVTATDGDGDHVTSGAVDISNQITFLDDGPTVNPTVHADATVSLDETGPAVASTISTGAIVKGDDPDVSGSGAISKATSGVAIVDAHAAFGADGPAASNSLSYALSITNASSGLTTTDGHAINLVAQGGVIVGVVSGGTFDGQAAFAISIDSSTGVVTVEQYLSLNQPITTDPNDAVHMLTGSIGVTVTATDGDGDHVTSGAVDISNQIIFHDDGPTAHADVNSVSEGGHVSGNVETNDLFGADGKASGGGVTGVEAGSHPTDIVTTGVGQTIAGTFGSLVLNADGTYTYTATPNTNPPPGSTDVFTYTITDGDGDKSTTTLTITVNDVTLNPDNQTKVVNEAALDLNKDGADLAAGTVTGSNPGSTAETVQGTLGVVGATGYTAEDLTGTHGVFHLNANGTYTYTLTSPVDGTTADNGTNTVNGVETFTYTAHDADGNTVTGTVTINVIDDVPTAHADTDSVTEDGPLVADGNVLTGSGGSDLNSTDGVADTQGADGATVTGVKLPASGSFTSVPTGATGTTIIGSHGTLVLHADGSYTYTLNNADTSVQALGQGQSTTDTFNYQITDGDGDTSTTTLTITINGTNDAPVVGSSTATVSEEGLTGANPDNVGTPTDTTNSVTATGTVSFTDVDSGDTHTVTLTAPANGSLTSNGFNVIWTGSGTNTLHAFQDVNGNGLVDAGEKAIMTITINNSGAYTVTLQGPIDHPTANVEDVDGFGVTVNVSDGHTTSTGTLNVNVEDDSPVSFTPDPQPSLVDDGTASATGLINDPASNSTGVNFIGADGFGSLFFTGTSALDGTALKDANNVALTSHGQPILLSGFGTDTLTAYVDSGAHAGFQSGEDTVVFTVTLNDGTTYGSDATYTINFSDTIDNGSGVSFNDLTSTAAGNVDYRGVGADSASTPIDLLLSGTASGGVIGTVNTDSTAIGVANQSMDAGESLRIDFVSDLASGGAGPTGFNFSGHVSSNGFIGFIPQVQGAQSNTVSFTVYALDTTVTQSGAPDSNPTGGFSDGSVLQTTNVYVQDYLTGNTATLDVSSFEGDGLFHTVGFGISVKVNSDGSVTFQGVQEGDHYGVTTATDFNAIVVQDNSGSFDLGVFSLSQTNQGSNIDMNFGVTAQDADGDTSTGTIAVTLTPEAQQNAPIHTAMTTMAPLSTASTDTSSLTASNDNTDHGQQRTFNVANNTALMGAIAAAGLDSMHGLQLDHASVSGLDHGSSSLQPTHDMVVSSAPVEAPHVDTSPDTQVLATATSHAAPQSGGAAHDMVVSSQPLTPANAQPAAPTDLPHGSEGPAHAAAEASAVVAMAVTMPSAAQLAAAASHGVSQAPDSVGGATPQHEQVVSKVLVDALHGGGGGSVNIDGLLNNAGIHGASQDALQALASHGSAAVSFGHTAFADAFGGAHGMLLMHPDVAPPVHG